MEVVYLADKHQMQTLKDEILQNHAKKIFLNRGTLEKNNFKELSYETKMILAKSRIVHILESFEQEHVKYMAKVLDENLTAILQKRETQKKPYKLSFQNVFNKPDDNSDVEIKVNGKYSFHLHRLTLKRLAGTIGDMVIEEKNSEVNIQLDKNEDVGIFLLMLRLFYPKHHVDLSPGKNNYKY